MSYLNWGDKEPAGDKTTLVLKKDPEGSYQWRTEWAGSYKQFPVYSHSFICERDTTGQYNIDPLPLF
jgi:hypothetical protein